jgi:hypothetical protein
LEVTRLRTLTAKRAEGEFDLELSVGAITEELAVYPEDIVVDVCRNWARNNKWFPTLSELIAECEVLFDDRRRLLSAAKATRPAITSPKPRQDRHDIPKDQWDKWHWAEYVTEAENMVALAEQNPTIFSKDEWTQTVASRRMEQSSFLKSQGEESLAA